MKNDPKDFIPTRAFLVVAVAGVLIGTALSEKHVDGYVIAILVIFGLLYGLLFKATVSAFDWIYDRIWKRNKGD